MSAAREVVVQALRTSCEDGEILAHRMHSAGGAVSLMQSNLEQARAALSAAEVAVREATDDLDALGAEYTANGREYVALTELLVEVELGSMGPTRAEQRVYEARKAAEVIPVEVAADSGGLGESYANATRGAL